MATTNVTITSAWTKIAESSDSFLVTWDSQTVVEIAATATDTAPVVNGHRLGFGDAITRDLIGTGFVWAKTAGGVPSSLSVVVSK